MIISEKQIMELIYIATEQRRDLLLCKDKGILTETGQQSLNDISSKLQEIISQQSTELKVVE